jgi:hypothetical protein
LIFSVSVLPGVVSSARPRMPNPSTGNSYPWLATEKNTFRPSRAGSVTATQPAESVTNRRLLTVVSSTSGTPRPVWSSTTRTPNGAAGASAARAMDEEHAAAKSSASTATLMRV